MVIRQFDLFPNPSTSSRRSAPYAVVLQSEYAGDLHTVIVAPVYHAAEAEFLTQITVRVTIDMDDFIVSVPELTAVNSRVLRRRAGTLGNYEDEIRRALDRLFTGF